MHPCVCASVQISPVITPTFMHEFQNYLTCCPLRGEVPLETFLGRLKVNVTLEGRIN